MYKNVLKSRYGFHLNQRFQKYIDLLTHLENQSEIIYSQKEFEQNK